MWICFVESDEGIARPRGGCSHRFSLRSGQIFNSNFGLKLQYIPACFWGTWAAVIFVFSDFLESVQLVHLEFRPFFVLWIGSLFLTSKSQHFCGSLHPLKSASQPPSHLCFAQLSFASHSQTSQVSQPNQPVKKSKMSQPASQPNQPNQAAKTSQPQDLDEKRRRWFKTEIV